MSLPFKVPRKIGVDHQFAQDAMAEYRLLLDEALPNSFPGKSRIPELLKLGVASWNVQRLQIESRLIDSKPQADVPEHFRGLLTYRMMLQVPKFYNADRRGVRKPIESVKFDLTLEEIKQRFPGHSRLDLDGWSRDDGNDMQSRFEIDSLFDLTAQAYLTLWKTMLEARFQQRKIYITFLGPVAVLD